MHDFSMIHEINFHSSRLVFLSSFRYHRWSTDNSNCLLVFVCDSHKSGGYNLCPLSVVMPASQGQDEWDHGPAQTCSEHRYPCPGLELNYTLMWLLGPGQELSRRLPTAHIHRAFSQLLLTEPFHSSFSEQAPPRGSVWTCLTQAAKPPWKWEGAAVLMGLSGFWKP